MESRIANEVLQFWRDAGPSRWWRKDQAFDDAIKARFGALYKEATARKLDSWREESHSCLALVIILDQFSRNLFRGSDKSFAQDDYALELAKYGVAQGFDREENKDVSIFFYLPYMHSEEPEDQEICVELMRATGNRSSIDAAIEHRDIIARFGRFPHRNVVLNRTTSEEEQAFLDEGGFSG